MIVSEDHFADYGLQEGMNGLGSAGTPPSFDPISAVVNGATAAILMWMNRKGPKQKVATTAIVNEVEPLLQQNLAAWNSSPQTTADQQAAVSNFDQLWEYVVSGCDRPELGNPGQACINDRRRGSSKGYDWFKLYRDPIALAATHDPPPPTASLVVNDVTSIFGGSSGSGSGGGIDASKFIIPALLVGGIILIGFMGGRD